MTHSLTALALTCSLKPSPAPSSSQLMAQQVLDGLAGHGVSGESVRVVDHDVRPGVLTDMGEGDAWPAIREKVLAADILVLVTPTWMGHTTSVAQRVLAAGRRAVRDRRAGPAAHLREGGAGRRGR